MGNHRSRSGCLTCRARRVKCDEGHPVCKACSKRNRPCQWDTPQSKFKVYQPQGASEKSTLSAQEHDGDPEAMDVDGRSGEGQVGSRTFSPTTNHSSLRRNSRPAVPHVPHVPHVPDPSSHNTSALSGQAPAIEPSSEPSGSHESTKHPDKAGHAESIALRWRSQVVTATATATTTRTATRTATRPYSDTPIPLTRDEAELVHHYTEYLGRWLDCTDATRQFTLGVPGKVKTCPVLCYAVLSFAARHRKEEARAETAYQRCIPHLIERLNETTASHDETLLCAIVILRFYEQLTVPSNTGSDEEQHLAGTQAILRASQGHHFVDPSAPTLREAAFWVYVRQCLYNATINQSAPQLDLSLQLHPTPSSMQDAHPLARLRLETAWANQMTWNLAHVVNYCFDTHDAHGEHNYRVRRWQELWSQVDQWNNERPDAFNPIWEGKAHDRDVFPDVWFTTDWHVISFGFYHFACILLLIYKPGPKFAIRNAIGLSDTTEQILKHAHVICGACKSSPETGPLSITVCHTIFIWGPLVTDQRERDAIVELLVAFEQNHLWPTTWIINALKKEWGMR